MLRRLQRHRGKSKAQAEEQQANTTASSSIGASIRVSFFDLPAELRNRIYELTAQDASLDLFNAEKNNNKKSKDAACASTSSSSAAAVGPHLPGLLLTSKQSRHEYLPILLSTAAIRATVTDFHFRRLTRILGSLYNSELKALRANDRLVIRLRIRQCDHDVYANLRRWCIARAGLLGCLGWTYELERAETGASLAGSDPLSPPPSFSLSSLSSLSPRSKARRREHPPSGDSCVGASLPAAHLRWYYGGARVLFEKEENEHAKWEVGRILAAFERAENPDRLDSVYGRMGSLEDFVAFPARRRRW